MTSRSMLHTINVPKVQELLNSKNEIFDLVILENFDTDAFLAFGHHYDAPVVLVTTLASSNWVNDLTGNPAPFSYLPDLFLSYSDQMSFFQRVHNTLILTMHHMYRHFVTNKRANDFIQTYFPGAPSIHDLKKRISLVLMNSHVSVNHPRPHLPHMIEIGGFHVEDQKPLSKVSVKIVYNSNVTIHHPFIIVGSATFFRQCHARGYLFQYGFESEKFRAPG